MSDTDCGYAFANPDGREEPCGKKATGWRWYQDVLHEDSLEPACDWHANEGGRRMAEMTDKLNEIREVISQWWEHESGLTRDDVIEKIDEILDHPAAAPGPFLDVEGIHPDPYAADYDREAAKKHPEHQHAAAPAKKPPWFVVKHCCEAGAVAYPNPCPWHGVGRMCGSHSPATGRCCVLVGGHVIEHASGATDDEWRDPPRSGQVVEHQPTTVSEDWQQLNEAAHKLDETVERWFQSGERPDDALHEVRRLVREQLLPALDEGSSILRGEELPATDSEAREVDGQSWRIAIDVPLNLPDELREKLFDAVADAVHEWEPENREAWDAIVFAYACDHSTDAALDRAVAERDALRAEVEQMRVLQSFAAGDGSQPYYSGTPAFVQWQKDCVERDELTAKLRGIWDDFQEYGDLDSFVDRVGEMLGEES